MRNLESKNAKEREKIDKLESKRTEETRKVEDLLRAHFPDHPKRYPPLAYRYNSACIRVRVVSKRFSGLDPVDRWDMVVPILKANLPEATWEDLSLILLMTPDEVKDSLANITFENPEPCRL